MDFNAMLHSLQSTLGSQLPHLIGALALFVLGWIVALVARAGVRRSLGYARLNQRVAEATGQAIDVENAVAVAVFWVILLVTLVGVFNSLDLALLSGPFSALTTQVFEYVPKLFAGVVLALVAWLTAALVRMLAKKALDATTLDEKLSQHAGIEPVGKSIGQVLFWIVILLFIPAILGALQMEGLLDPFREMVAKALAMLPNVFAAALVGLVGWVLAKVLRGLTTNLLHAAGADKLGASVGLAQQVRLSHIAGTLVFIVVFVPSLIAALDALKIEAISKPATDMLGMILAAVPNIIAAGLILVVSWYVASFASALLARLLASLGFDTLPARIGFEHAFRETRASTLVGRIALFFAMLFATVEAANRLAFTQVRDIVAMFIKFGGDVLLGSAILAIGFWLANLAYAAIDRASGPQTKGLARVGRFAILGLVIAMGLRAMGIADDIVNLAFGLTLGAIAVAFALSFGLGGREAAGRLMDHWLAKFRKEG
ncbi:MAG: mechanosensitive ion channel [Burkholderiales bacterium]|nr:mechanosensitive ion channel [Burkholderiales bacterium]